MDTKTTLHSLNNKLGIILGNSELLLDTDLPKDILRHVHQINHACIQACDLVRSIAHTTESITDITSDTTTSSTETTSAP